MSKGRNHASLNKPKPNTAETSLLVSIVEAPVYAIILQYEAFVTHGQELQHKAFFTRFCPVFFCKGNPPPDFEVNPRASGASSTMEAMRTKGYRPVLSATTPGFIRKRRRENLAVRLYKSEF